jgi:ABC-type Mn2+/Zn2+ transport system ATPase subunit
MIPTIRAGNVGSRYLCCTAVRNAPFALPYHLTRLSVFLDMLQIDNLVFNGWGRRFFDSATVSLPVGAKVGLVGRNGVGKSTLFKLILGQLTPDGGEISLPKAARIASVDQEHPATPVTLLDTVLPPTWSGKG